MEKKKLWIIGIILFQGILLSAGTPLSLEYGNVNSDQSVNIIDALLTAQYSVGLVPSVFNPEAADVDASGTITIRDALLIARYAVGQIDTFPAESASGGVEVVRSLLERNPAPGAETGEMESVVSGINQFGFDCYRELIEDGQNLFISPLSINYAFAMCYAGANGNTKAQMEDVLRITLPEDRYHNALNNLDQIITVAAASGDTTAGEDLKLNLANSTWGQQGHPFQSSYLDTLALHYGAAMNTVDFRNAPDHCRILINDWVSEETEEKINDLLPSGSIDSLTRLVITNAIYFKATWCKPFEAENTAPGTFYAPGGPVTADMMHQNISTGYKEVPGEYQIVLLAYNGKKRNDMYIIMPAPGKFAEIESRLSQEYWAELTNGLRGYRVNLSMPKFGIEWDSSLIPALTNLGMTDAFNAQQADFSGIDGSRDLSISNVIHKSFIKVDEKGTEAAAATAITISATSVPPPATMTLDRPFIFMIGNETGAILFLGRVMTP